MSDLISWIQGANSGPIAWADGGIFFILFAAAFIGWVVYMRMDEKSSE